jgi:ABC-2 type transport system permease protein
MTALAHMGFMFLRHWRALLRQPWYIAFTLVQPIIWLVFYGELFKRVVELPGFGASNYLTFITPGIVVMTALFGGGWTGMGVIQEMEQGTLERFLVSPISRGGMIAGRLLAMATTNMVQSAVLVALGYALGARFASLAGGLVVLIACALLLSAAVAGLSSAMALMVRKRESVIGAVNFVLLPLTFLSSTFMAPALMPGWIRSFAKVNPVNWAIEAGREALKHGGDPGLVLSRLAMLAAFALASGWLTTRAMRAYQRSL